MMLEICLFLPCLFDLLICSLKNILIGIILSESKLYFILIYVQKQ